MCPDGSSASASAITIATPMRPGQSLSDLAGAAADAVTTAKLSQSDFPDNLDDEPLYSARKKIYPQRVRGTFRRLKWGLLVVTLGIYYFLPFIRWDRGLNAPNQAVLIDFPGRRFYFFFIEIWPQEVLPGIVDARLNFTQRRLAVEWHDREINAERIVAALEQIGYRAYPFAPE